MHPFIDLTGQHILITGASSGIGQACAVLAAEYGATCILSGRDATKLEATRQMLPHTNAHTIIPCDLASPTNILPLVEQAAQTAKTTAFIHAAGTSLVQPITFHNPEVAARVFQINYHAFIEIVHLLTKKRYATNPSIVAISSVSATRGWRGGSAYAGTKGALCASVKALAVELASKGIRINTVMPATIDTPLLRQTTPDLDALSHTHPLGVGQPLDVARAAIFLISQAATYITGTDLVVDGGFLAQ